MKLFGTMFSILGCIPASKPSLNVPWAPCTEGLAFPCIRRAPRLKPLHLCTSLSSACGPPHHVCNPYRSLKLSLWSLWEPAQLGWLEVFSEILISLKQMVIAHVCLPHCDKTQGTESPAWSPGPGTQ